MTTDSNHKLPIVPAYSIATLPLVSLIKNGLESTILRRGHTEKVTVHNSDHDSQYCSKDYRQLLGEYKHSQSMSRKGNYSNNAWAESFFRSLKVEAINEEPILSRKTVQNRYLNT